MDLSQTESRRAIATAQRFLRDSEFLQIFCCAALGAITGFGVELLRELVIWLHTVIFLLPPHGYLSTGIGVAQMRIAVVPVLGGLLAGMFARAARDWRRTDIVDPIEANALYGGRLSLIDSIRLAIATLIANGAGASLGMEAGYSQLGAAVHAQFGHWIRLRRADQRIFVSAGAAAAIAAAFNAPLAGAFYGFELILGSYTPRALAPIAVASVCAVLVERALTGSSSLFEVSGGLNVPPQSYALFALMGVVASVIAILTMRMVTLAERLLRATELPRWLWPVVGGMVLTSIALYFPQVLGSGHGAIQLHLDQAWPWTVLLMLLVAKIAASAVSVGSGFRGGLFSSSLFIGVLFGGIFSAVVAMILPEAASASGVFMLAGMASIGAAIIGAPLTMVFLVLEATGDFPATVAVLVTVVIAATIVRLTFGYSFATWRFHVRGLGIRGAHDVGWIADLTVGRLMRADPKLVLNNTSIRVLRELYPPGSTRLVYVVDDKGAYHGSIDVVQAHSGEIDEALDSLVAADLAQSPGQFLLPGDNIRTAMRRFEEVQREVLPVLTSKRDGKVVGYLTEAYALKRYTQELESTRVSEIGALDLPGSHNSSKP